MFWNGSSNRLVLKRYETECLCSHYLLQLFQNVLNRPGLPDYSCKEQKGGVAIYMIARLTSALELLTIGGYHILHVVFVSVFKALAIHRALVTHEFHTRTAGLE